MASRPTPNTKWSMSIFYHMQKISFVIRVHPKALAAPSQHSLHTDGVVDVLMTQTHIDFLEACIGSATNSEQNKLCSNHIYLLFIFCFKCNVSVYVAHGCAFGWHFFFSSFPSPNSIQWMLTLFRSYKQWTVQNEWQEKKENKTCKHKCHSLSLLRTIHFYGIQSVETIHAVKW